MMDDDDRGRWRPGTMMKQGKCQSTGTTHGRRRYEGAVNTVKAVEYEGHVQHRRGKSRGDKRHNKVVSTVLILVS